MEIKNSDNKSLNKNQQSIDDVNNAGVRGKIPSHFRLKIVLPNKVAYDGDVEFIKFNSPDGELMMYPGHEHYICSIAPSKLEFKTGAGTDVVEIKQGFCKFQDNFCQIAVSEV